MWRAVLFVVLVAAAEARAEPFGPFRTHAAPVTADARVERRPSEQLPADKKFVSVQGIDSPIEL